MESTHSEAGCKLFNQYCEEVPGLRNDCREDIFAAADKVLELETTFLKSIFSKGNVRTISYDQLINFVKHRLNSKLQEIGYTEKTFEVNKTLLDEISWFNMLSAGREFQDFFANRVTEYTEINASAEDLF
jgi:ribonucleoside-diphosphate reductase beta chain